MLSLRRIFVPLLAVTFLGVSACTVNVPVLERDAVLRAGEERLARIHKEQSYNVPLLDPADAIARALLFNLDYRAAFMSESVAREDLARSQYLLWPQLAAGAGYSARDRYSLSVSRDPATGSQTLQPSTSSDRKGHSAQLQLSWNALDFGVGYLRAKQKGNAALVAEEQRRKAFQTIVQEVTFAWWRAAAAQSLEPRLKELRGRIESALQRSREMERLRLNAQFPVLEYRRDLLLSLKRISAFEEELLNARNELARLVVVPEGEQMVLAPVDEELTPRWLPPMSREQMRRIALANRPELRELGYRERIAALEGKVAVAGVFPSLGLSAASRYDSNSYLIHNGWNELNANFSFNLLSLAALPSNRRYGKTLEAMESLRADAMTVAVLSQLDIALRAVESDRSSLCLSRELDRIAGERERQQHARDVSAAGDELSLIRTEVEAALASIENAFSRADLEASQALLLNSLGVDPYPEELSRDGPDALAMQLRAYFDTGLRERLQKEVVALAEDASSGERPAPALKSFEALCSL